jgi:hypothetical protein
MGVNANTMRALVGVFICFIVWTSGAAVALAQKYPKWSLETNFRLCRSLGGRVEGTMCKGVDGNTLNNAAIKYYSTPNGDQKNRPSEQAKKSATKPPNVSGPNEPVIAVAPPAPSKPNVLSPPGPSATSALAEKRVALVIGNSAYVNVPRLDNPGNDARLMADTLRSLGFTIVGGGPQIDLTGQAFRQVVQDFGKRLEDSDVGLFYYAGHGVQVRGSNYLVPVDATPTREADIDFQMVDGNLVLRQMEGAGTKLNIMILDACRNNPFGGRGLRATGGGLAQMDAAEGTLISFATQPGNVALEGTDDHSPYTEALAQIMRKPGLDIFHTFNDVGLAVVGATGGAQKPWISSSPIKGDFYFAGVPAGAANP